MTKAQRFIGAALLAACLAGCSPAARAKTCTAYEAARSAACAACEACAELSARPCPFEAEVSE